MSGDACRSDSWETSFFRKNEQGHWGGEVKGRGGCWKLKAGRGRHEDDRCDECSWMIITDLGVAGRENNGLGDGHRVGVL